MRYFIYCRKSSEAEDRQVASIESQLTTLQRTFGGRSDIEIVGVYEEAFSAKAPGRAKFNEMLAEIEKGVAQGIVAWAPDRLARNSIDGGRLIYMVDRAVIRDLKFATYTFENNSQGKFMLQIMFGQSKYYSDALSDNVKRGNRTKIESGWIPNKAPLGYLNDATTKTIVRDPVRFPLIRKMFDLMLTGSYSPKEIALIARDEWGLRTPQRKRSGGKPLAMSSVYWLLSNPFYSGMIIWNGQTHPGKHEPLVSIDEFRMVRRLIDRPNRPRPKQYTFAFRGMIRCGACGLGVTAEHKVKRSGRQYTYYHCTRPRLGQRCAEPSIEVQELERQIVVLLRSISIDPKIENWVNRELAVDGERLRKEAHAYKQSLEQAQHEVSSQLHELTDLRLRNLLDDEEFRRKREELQQEQLRLRGKLSGCSQESDLFEPLRSAVSFSNRAANRFSSGSDREKRAILDTVCSNLLLEGKKLKYEAKKPFALLAKMTAIPCRLGVDDDARTLRCTFAKLAKTIWRYSKTEEGQHVMSGIRAVLNHDEEALAKLDAQSRRQRKSARAVDAVRSGGAQFQSHQAA